MKTTINAETLKSSGNLHAIFNAAELLEIIPSEYWIKTTLIELTGNFDKLTVKTYTIDDDFNINFEAEDEPIKAEILAHGSIVLSPEMLETISAHRPETIEVFQDMGSVVFCLDGKSRYFFDADFLQEIEEKRIEKEEEEEKQRKEWEEKQDERFLRAITSEKPTSAILNIPELYKGISHSIDKTTSATIENGFLYVIGQNCVSVRNIGNDAISTNNIGFFIKALKTEKGCLALTQYPDGKATLDDINYQCLTRPTWLEWDYGRKIKPLFGYDFYCHGVLNLPQILRKLRAADKIVLTNGEIKIVLPVGTLKKSLAHFKGNTLFSVGKSVRNYLVITSEGSQDFDIITALSIDPKGHDFQEIKLDFIVNEAGTEAAKKAPKNDASTQAADDTTPTEKAPEKPEQPEPVKSTEKEPEPLPQSEPQSEPEPETAPTAAAPAPVRPLRAIIEDEDGEKPFEIGTYTTKKGKVKTAIRFNVTPPAEWVEALKKAYFWEYEGRWCGSPRKLPEIFKH